MNEGLAVSSILLLYSLCYLYYHFNHLLKCFIKESTIYKKNKNKYLKNSTKFRNYVKSSEEVFAEGWGQYLLNAKEFKSYAPEFFNYFEEINNLIEETYG